MSTAQGAQGAGRYPDEARRSLRRVVAVWCPDWPSVAAAGEAQVPPNAPLVVVSANRVVSCSAPARSFGIRRGIRRREAQARCPEVVVLPDDPDRDARAFDAVAAAVDAVAPGVEILRAGIVVLPARGALRWYGSEESVGEHLVDAVAAAGVESQVGIADELPTAVLAARRSVLVPPGSDAAFLAPLPIRDLVVEQALSGPGREDLVDLLHRLGLRTVGAFARLSPTHVGSRFGADAIRAHRTARGLPERPPSARALTPDLAVERRYDPPLDRVDTAAFAARTLARELHVVLADAASACTRLTVVARTAHGQERVRTWRCAEPLTPESTADRVRWQLDGWLTGRSGDRPTAGVETLRLEPVEVVTAGALQHGLWGGVGEDSARARRAVIRVQGLLGGEAVTRPVLGGGRGPRERVSYVPFGEEAVPSADPSAPWPGRLPSPAPTTILESVPVVHVGNATGGTVLVTDRGMLDSDPVVVRWGSREWPVSGWAGPWPVDEYWWDRSDARAAARLQVILDGAPALLVLYEGGRWHAEGVYE